MPWGLLAPAARGAQTAIRVCSTLFGGRTSLRKASPWKVCDPEKKEPPPPWWSPGAASGAPSVSGLMREGAAQPPDPPGGAASVVRSPKSLFPRGTNGSLRCSAPFGSVSLSLPFWAVDNPHTRKSCLLGPADCSSPTPPSPLPPLPPPSLPPGAPGQLARGQDCHCRCWCGSSCRCRRGCCFWDRDQAPLTPHLLGPSPALPRREGLWRAEGRRRSLQNGPGFPCRHLLAAFGLQTRRSVGRD